MVKINLTEEERRELLRLEKQIPFKGVAIRIRIILALDLGYSVKEVSEILLLDEDTIIKWKKKYLESKFLSDWLGDEYVGYQGKLARQEELKIDKFVSEETVTDCLKVVDYIKEDFGIDYTIDGVTKLLHRLGFVYKQTVIIPANLDINKQKQFLKEYRKLKKNIKETEKILFLDGVHPTHNTRSLKCWVKKGVNKQIKTNTGRDRLNIHGALNVEDLDVTSRFSPTLNAQTTIEFFDQIQTKYAHLTSIFCIVDNAAYYKNKDVKLFLQNPACKLKLIFLPSYSPNLNYIERLWKFLKKYIIGVKYRQKFKEFEEDIGYFLNHTEKYHSELKPFIGTKLHLIEA